MNDLIKSTKKQLGKLKRTLLRDHSGQMNTCYDDLTKKVIQAVVIKNSICIDVGCFKGEILDMMISNAPEGKFYAFEPVPQLFQGLQGKYNGDKRVQLLNLAASNYSGNITFHHVTTNPGYSGFLERRFDRPDEQVRQITVTTDKLDNIIKEDRPVDLIKIDVEGAELQVLQGAANLVRDKPVIIFEHGLGAADVYETTPESVFDFLHDECGLEISLLDVWLKGGTPLNRVEFRRQFYEGINYYFMAHPAKTQI